MGGRQATEVLSKKNFVAACTTSDLKKKAGKALGETGENREGEDVGNSK